MALWISIIVPEMLCGASRCEEFKGAVAMVWGARADAGCVLEAADVVNVLQGWVQRSNDPLCSRGNPLHSFSHQLLCKGDIAYGCSQMLSVVWWYKVSSTCWETFQWFSSFKVQRCWLSLRWLGPGTWSFMLLLWASLVSVLKDWLLTQNNLIRFSTSVLKVDLSFETVTKQNWSRC